MDTYSPDYAALVHLLVASGLAIGSSLIAITVMSRMDKSIRSAGDKLIEDFATVMVPFVIGLFAMTAVALALESKSTVALVVIHISSALSGAVLFGLCYACGKISQGIDMMLAHCDRARSPAARQS